MSALRVGMRARVRWSLHFPKFEGRECVITAGPCVFYSPSRQAFYEGWDTDLGPDFGPTSDQLEPILYDGNQLVEWSECLWQPEGQAA